MKKIIISIVTLFSSFAVFADEALIINTGSDSGGFKAVLSMVGEKLDHKFVQANNPIVAAQYFDEKNILTMWSTEWPADPKFPSVDINENTIVALQVYETILCSRKYNSLNEMNGDTVKIATWGDSPAVEKFLKSLGNSNNINFKIVPYGGSGSTTRGYLGKDADTIFTIQTRQSKVESDGNCFAFSSNGDLDFSFVDVMLSVNTDKENLYQWRNVVSQLMKTESWKTTFDGTETYICNGSCSSLVSRVNSVIELYQ